MIALTIPHPPREVKIFLAAPLTLLTLRTSHSSPASSPLIRPHPHLIPSSTILIAYRTYSQSTRPSLSPYPALSGVCVDFGGDGGRIGVEQGLEGAGAASRWCRE